MRELRLGALGETSPAGVLGALSVAVWVVWARLGGGFDPDRWGPIGLVLVLAFALAVGRTTPDLARWGGPLRMTVLALAAFVVLNYLSVLWADFPGTAWRGADKTLLYAVTFLVFAAWARSARENLLVLALFSLGIAVVGAVVLAQVATSGNLDASFDDARLVAPTGYANATVALAMLAFWPAVFLGSTRALPAPLRPLFLGASSFLLGLAVLGQSRAWLVAAPVTAVLFLALARQRLRLLLGLVLAGAGTLSVIQPLLDVYEHRRAGVPLEADVDRAALLLLASAVGVAVVGAAWVLLDGRLRVGARAHRALGVAVLLGVTVAVAAAVAWGASRVDDPGTWVADRWEEITRGGFSGETSSRFGDSLGSNRSTEWRVAWHEFLGHPAIGIGVDNFQASYLLEREDPDHGPLYPHSIPLRLLSQVAAVGTQLALAWLGLAVALGLRRRRALDPLAGGAVGAALTVLAYWLVQGSADWFWEIPALAAPAFGLLGLAASSVRSAGESRGEGRQRPEVAGTRARRIALLGLGGAATLVACVALALPWLAYDFRKAGAREWMRDSAKAYSRLELAADLDPLDAAALVTKGSIALRLRDVDRARDALTRALEREPKNWYATLQLGLLAAWLGDYEEADRRVARALALNPLDRVALIAADMIDRRVPINPDELNAWYVAAA